MAEEEHVLRFLVSLVSSTLVPGQREVSDMFPPPPPPNSCAIKPTHKELHNTANIILTLLTAAILSMYTISFDILIGVLKSINNRVWRGGLLVKKTCYTSRGIGLSSQHPIVAGSNP